MQLVHESVVDTIGLLSDGPGNNDLVQFFGGEAPRRLVELWRQHRIIPATFGPSLSKALCDTDSFGRCHITMPIAAMVYRSPLGAYIKLNLDGAFFKEAVTVWYASNHELPYRPRPIIAMFVGDRYPGRSREARVLILLHELGHVLGVLPMDGSDPEGRIVSERNNRAILDRCRTPLASLGRREISIAALRQVDGH